MKIRYINEAFKKISDLKGNIDKINSQEKVYNTTVRELIESFLHSENIAYHINKIVKKFCSFNFYPYEDKQTINLLYNGIKDAVLHIGISVYTPEKICIELCNFYDMTVEDVRKEIDKNITEKIFNEWNNYSQDIQLTNIIKSIHIDNITIYNSEGSSLEVLFNTYLKGLSVIIDNFLPFSELIVFGAKNLTYSSVRPNKCVKQKYSSESKLYKNLFKTLEYYKQNKKFKKDELFNELYDYANVDYTNIYKILPALDIINLRKYIACRNWDECIIKEQILPIKEFVSNSLIILCTPFADNNINVYDYLTFVWWSRNPLSDINPYNHDFMKNIEWLTIIIKSNDNTDDNFTFLLYNYGEYLGEIYKLKVPNKNKILGESFKKISDLKMDANKERSSEDFRISVLRDEIKPVLEDEDFQKNCSWSISKIFKRNANTDTDNEIPLGIMNFKYKSIDNNSVLHLSGEVYYSQKQGYYDKSLRSVTISENNAKTMSEDEIRNYIENYIFNEFCTAAEKYNPNIKNGITGIHIDKIKLWSNAPEAVDGICDCDINFYFENEKTGYDAVLSDKDTLEIFNKLTSIFEFCIKHPILEKYRVQLDKINSEYDVSTIKKICVDYANRGIYKKDKADEARFLFLKKYIENPKLEEYKIGEYKCVINLYKYLKSSDIESSITDQKGTDNYRLYLFAAEPINKLNKEEFIHTFNMCSYPDDEELTKLLEDYEFFGIMVADRKNELNTRGYDHFLIQLYNYGNFIKTFSLKNDNMR